MRKVILIAMVLVVIQVPAQDRQRGPHKQEHRERTQMFQDFSPEEIAALHTKRMTLELDLTQAQQNEIYRINLENVKTRKAKMKAHKQKEKVAKEKSKEERLQHMNEKLDHQIAVKKKMKAILDAQQYEKWSERSMQRGKRKQSQKRRKKE